jgi:hypothetical protein
MSHNLGMNAGRESDGRVVPAKCPNKGGSLSPAEGMEGRRLVMSERPISPTTSVLRIRWLLLAHGAAQLSIPEESASTRPHLSSETRVAAIEDVQAFVS